MTVLALRLESSEDPRVAAMKTIFTTAEVDPKSRFDYWHSVACKNLVNHDSEPESRQTSQATLKCGNLGSIGLVLFENSPMRVAHTKHHIAHANSDVYFLCRQVAGRDSLSSRRAEVSCWSQATWPWSIPGCPAGAYFPIVRECWF
jgi:hypothetical protein